MLEPFQLKSKYHVAIMGCFDTKGEEYLALVSLIMKFNVNCTLINIGIFPSTLPSSIVKAAIETCVFTEAVGFKLEELQKRNRAEAIYILKKGIQLKFSELAKTLKFDAIIGMGGTNGTDLITTAMRTLPFEVPKICITTVAQHDNFTYTRECSGIELFNSVTDIGGGLNSTISTVIRKAVGSLMGMLSVNEQLQTTLDEKDSNKISIAISQFGTTTACVNRCADALKKFDDRIEINTFHMVGTGGKILEFFIRANKIQALLEVTPTELADLYGDGVFSAGFDRLNAAIEMNIPQVFIPGGLDLVNLGPYEEASKDPRFMNRKLRKCNDTVTVMRTNIIEYQKIARHINDRFQHSKVPIKILFPLKGFSQFDKPDDTEWYDPSSNAYFLAELRRLTSVHCKHVEIIAVDCNINDKEFADIAIDLMKSLLKDLKVASTVTEAPNKITSSFFKDPKTSNNTKSFDDVKNRFNLE